MSVSSTSSSQLLQPLLVGVMQGVVGLFRRLDLIPQTRIGQRQRLQCRVFLRPGGLQLP